MDEELQDKKLLPNIEFRSRKPPKINTEQRYKAQMVIKGVNGNIKENKNLKNCSYCYNFQSVLSPVRIKDVLRH